MLRLHIRGGIYHIRGTVAGRRIRESTGTRDQETAERIRVETEARAHRVHLYGAQQEATFADAALIYQQAGKPGRYLVPIILKLGKRRLDTITAGELKALARTLYPGAKHSTLNRSVIKPARAVINFAAESGMCHPIRVKRFKEASVIRHAVDRDWIDAFRSGAQSCLRADVADRISAAALLMFTTGMRLGEVVALAPGHLDLAHRRIELPTTITKTDEPRIVWLTQEVADELARLPAKLTHYGRGRPSVFGWTCIRGPQQPWRRACAAAGIPYRLRHEAGRHSFATEMIVRRGIDIKTTAEMGGWRDARVLLGYTHAEDMANVAERVFGTSATQRQASHTKKIKAVK